MFIHSHFLRVLVLNVVMLVFCTIIIMFRTPRRDINASIARLGKYLRYIVAILAALMALGEFLNHETIHTVYINPAFCNLLDGTWAAVTSLIMGFGYGFASEMTVIFVALIGYEIYKSFSKVKLRISQLRRIWGS